MSGLGPIDGLGAGAADRIAGADAAASAATPGRASRSPDFADSLIDAVRGVEGAEREADELATRFTAGAEDVGLHEVMLATGKANVAVRFAVTLKNRMLESYRELMKTPI